MKHVSRKIKAFHAGGELACQKTLDVRKYVKLHRQHKEVLFIGTEDGFQTLALSR